ncbi:MAG: DNA-binding protein [Candidatus Poseidoniaceae archaeon]|tara:strand:- start:4930 stop:5289 length:360 start_codon:yes stop_codon:yes gene_type:complete
MSTSHDDELNMLREQRRAALQQQLEAQAAQQADAEVQAQQAQVQAAQLDGAMRTLLSNEARSRLATVALATPARAASIKQNIVQLHSQGKFQAPMSDDQLKQLLASHSKSRRSASIRRI